MTRTLREFLDLQRKLDEVCATKRDAHAPYTDATQNGSMKMACLVEIGELANELAFFKYWKKSKTVNIEKVKEEFADVMHFIFALNNIDKMSPKIGVTVKDIYKKATKINDIQSLFGLLYKNIIEYKSGNALLTLITLGKSLDFTYEDIEKAYDDKMAINYKRLEGDY